MTSIPPGRRPLLRKWLLRTAVAVLAAGLLLVLLELGVRVACPEINYLDTDARLFVQDVHGATHGNAPDFRGRSFGARVSTDRLGFRPVADTHLDRPALLLLGDSVTFGVGVEDGSTFADFLASRSPDRRVINAGCIGYDVEDYGNFVERFVLPRREELRIETVVLGFCLNDLSPVSGESIRTAHAPGSAGGGGPVTWLNERLPFVNRLLRSRSKLFLLFKGLVFDSGRAYFEADLALYREADAVANLERRLAELQGALKGASIPLRVALFPYEYQLREGTAEEDLEPQRMVEAMLRRSAIPFLDLAEAFHDDMRRSGNGQRAYFLYNDPMHLSVLGHRVVAEALAAWLSASSSPPR